jgi:hypothetical protein
MVPRIDSQSRNMPGAEAPIGFCIPCMNRRWQVEETLPANLLALEGTPHFLALCDYNSRDGLWNYIEARHRDAIKSGTLLYFRTNEPEEFHYSQAKNTAHRLALTRAPTVLFNLDADNFITKTTLNLIDHVFSFWPDAVFHNWSGASRDGSYGRLAVSAEKWASLGGYDEQALVYAGMGQDKDFVLRARYDRLPYVHINLVERRAIQNTSAQKLENCGVADQFPGLSPDEIMTQVRAVTKKTMALVGSDKRSKTTLSMQRRFRGRINLLDSETVI